MVRRVLPLGVGLLLAAGCILDEPDRPLVVPPTTLGSKPRELPTHVASAPATEATSKRVLVVGQKLIDANPQIGLRPLFSTLGAPQVELFHRGPADGVLKGSQIFISEGLVGKCKNDGELAAVLAYELGRMVSEREALASPMTRRPDRELPPEVPIGNDSGGPRGSADLTRQMELAKADRDRRRPGMAAPPPPDPLVLARHYLRQTGFAPELLEDVSPLLRKADEEGTLEKTVTIQK